jgi:prepilin-type N-terminal cleavage/methylation domain-containing protein
MVDDRTNSKAARPGSDGGFTLVELLVVVAVIGVLVALAVPTFFKTKDSASAASAQSRATQGMKIQKTMYADGSGYVSDPARLEAAEPSIDFRTFDEDAGVATEVQGVVYIRDVTSEGVTVVARSPEGICYWARDDGGQTMYATGGCEEPPTEFSTRWP